MKPVLVLALLIVIANSFSFAQLNSNLIAHSAYASKSNPLFIQPAKPLQKEWLPPGYRMRRVGATLTLAGCFLIGGAVIVKNNSTLPISPAMVVGGVEMMVPGIIFWSKGAKKYRIYQAEQASTTVSLQLKSNGVIYRF